MKHKVNDKIRVRVKSTNKSDPRFQVGMEYDAVVLSDYDHPTYGIHFGIVGLAASCNERRTAHLDGGDWEIIE